MSRTSLKSPPAAPPQGASSPSFSGGLRLMVGRRRRTTGGVNPAHFGGPWDHWFHLSGHTDGTRLPGDERGFRTRHHRQHVEGEDSNPPPGDV